MDARQLHADLGQIIQDHGANGPVQAWLHRDEGGETALAVRWLWPDGTRESTFLLAPCDPDDMEP